jgi:hypothetical protein
MSTTSPGIGVFLIVSICARKARWLKLTHCTDEDSLSLLKRWLE